MRGRGAGVINWRRANKREERGGGKEGESAGKRGENEWMKCRLKIKDMTNVRLNT